MKLQALLLSGMDPRVVAHNGGWGYDRHDLIQVLCLGYENGDIVEFCGSDQIEPEDASFYRDLNFAVDLAERYAKEHNRANALAIKALLMEQQIAELKKELNSANVDG